MFIGYSVTLSISCPLITSSLMQPVTEYSDLKTRLYHNLCLNNDYKTGNYAIYCSMLTVVHFKVCRLQQKQPLHVTQSFVGRYKYVGLRKDRLIDLLVKNFTMNYKFALGCLG